MLVFVRKINESIMIGDDVKITIVDTGKGRVRVGIEAPRSVPVHRLEVYEDIKSGRGQDRYSTPQE